MDPGSFVRGGQALLPENHPDDDFFLFLFFSPQLILQFLQRGSNNLSMVCSEKCFLGFRGGLTFSTGSTFFQREGGPKANFYNPYNLSFSRGSRPPIPPLGPCMNMITLHPLHLFSM